MATKLRLDALLLDRGLAPSRTRAQALILAGRVRSGTQRLDKPGMRVAADLPLEVAEGRRFVGRGGHKLERAIEAFAIEPRGRDAIDVGASTGGFTQVLLESGFPMVIALDVGRGQLDWGLRNDPRVHVIEGCNARHLEPDLLPFSPSFASVDVSFISLRLILPALVSCLSGDREVVALVKPQFEAGRSEVGRGGIVRRPEVHADVLNAIADHAADHGWRVDGIVPSPIRGGDGNREFLMHLLPDAPPVEPALLCRWIDESTTTEEPE